ncbi:MAG TPA: MBL fold metallo-hydrolase [Candidatus Limnocylindria bacterium]|nr:MBL fold metallo-hydrolase [Candidatus Limnocylindria bacterium]
MRRLFAIFILLLMLPGLALSQGYDAVMDTSGDAGRLTFRFIAMDTTNGEKAGDAAVVTSPDGKVMVIDAGEPTAAPHVVRALEAMGVTAIDALVLSHPHVDHVGGMPALLRAFEVKAAYASQLDYDTSYTRDFLRALDEEGIALTRLARGDALPFGEEVSVSVLSPGETIEYYDKYPEGSTQFINDLSLVLMIEYRGTKALFSGDLYTLGERAVLDLGDSVDADLFKVNHHGDKTSSGKSWREAVSPAVAVITHNALADMRVPQQFEREGAAVYHTFLNGSVRVRTEGGGVLEAVTEK